MVQTAIAILAILVLAAMSLSANRRFKEERRLPMQWWVDGSVNWTAPRPIALAFTPVLAAICLLAMAVLGRFLQPRPGQEAMVIPVNIFVALTFIGAHSLHLWLIGKSLRSKP